LRQVYVDQALTRGALASVQGEAYVHLTRSLRARIGESVRMVDPEFKAFAGIIVSIDRHAATLQAGEPMPFAAEGPGLVLGLCAPAAEAFDAALEAAVQLGVTSFQALSSQHSRVPESAKMPRWERIVRESCCQSMRARTPRVLEPVALEDFLRASRPGLKCIAWQEAQAGPLAPESGPQSLVVGPEGGFSESEISLARELGWHFLNLGPHVLRVPVAVAAGLALLQASRAQ
jgi:16S rRNA (uracil1498-N3)-methyltransferase